VRHLVRGEEDARVLEQARAQEVGERVVFFFEEEGAGVGDAWERVSGVGGDGFGGGYMAGSSLDGNKIEEDGTRKELGSSR